MSIGVRKVVPLDTTGHMPANVSGMKQPGWVVVDPGDCWFEGHQRDFTEKSRKLGLHIFSNFAWSKFNVPVGTWRDGKLVILNGQTTVTACASHPDITAIPVLIVDAPEMASRAAAFVSHSRDRVAATPGQIWHGEVAAGNPEAIALQQVCMRAGLELLPYAPDRQAFKPGQTIAIGAVRRVIDRRGAEIACEVLEIACRTNFAPVTADLIKVVEELRCNPDFANDIDPDQIVATLQALGPRAHIEARALAVTKHLPMWRAIVAIVFKHRRARPKAAEPAAAHVPPTPEGHASPAPEPAPAKPVPASGKPHPMRRIVDRRPVTGPVPLGEPPAGRSALDERRKQGL